MNLQIIKSSNGQPEYVLLPVSVYKNLRHVIEKELKKAPKDYVTFDAKDYIDNPVALARIKAHVTQKELAKAMDVTQAYISKLENQDSVSQKILTKILKTLKTLKK